MNWRVPIIGLACCAALFWSQSASARDNGDGPISVTGVSKVSNAHIIDTRDLKSCTASSLPRARCLPVNYFKTPDGKVIGFHALRWLLGTVGLNGRETVLVIGDRAEDVKMVGALLYVAGQHNVQVLDRPFSAPVGAPPGDERSLSREVVFTQPMRDLDTVIRLP